MTGTNRKRNWVGLAVGLLLLALGVALLLHELGVISGSIFVRGWWALIIVALGVAKTVGAHRASDVGGGVMLTLLGGWLYLAHTGSYGLSYGNSWPLVLVAVGTGLVARSIAHHWMSDRANCCPREEHHG